MLWIWPGTTSSTLCTSTTQCQTEKASKKGSQQGKPYARPKQNTHDLRTTNHKTDQP